MAVMNGRRDAATGWRKPGNHDELCAAIRIEPPFTRTAALILL